MTAINPSKVLHRPNDAISNGDASTLSEEMERNAFTSITFLLVVVAVFHGQSLGLFVLMTY